MNDEIFAKHFDLEGMENGLEGLKEAVARAERLGEAARIETEASAQTAQGLSWTKAVEEAVRKVREINNNIREITEASLEAVQKAILTMGGTVKASDEVTDVLVRESEQTLRQAEEIGKAAKDVVKSSLRALQGDQSQVDEKTKVARKAAETAKKLSIVASDAAEVSIKVYQEAIKTSAEASKEAISRAEEISRLAKGAAETSIRAAAEVTEVSTVSALAVKKASDALTSEAMKAAKASTEAAAEVTASSIQAFREAAESSIKAFKALADQAEVAGIQANDIPETSMRSMEGAIIPEKTTGELEGETDKVSGGTLDEMVIEAEENKESYVTEEIEDQAEGEIEPRDVESRLEFLDRMYKIENAKQEKIDVNPSP